MSSSNNLFQGSDRRLQTPPLRQFENCEEMGHSFNLADAWVSAKKKFSNNSTTGDKLKTGVQSLLNPSEKSTSGFQKMKLNLNISNTTSTPTYIAQMFQNFSDESSIRSQQARITFFEAMMHFNYFNDLLFILRVAYAAFLANPKQNNSMGYFALSWLCTIWITSISGFCLRRWLIYHRIDGKDLKLFYPFVVFKQIRDSGDRQPDVLYMYKRVMWTFSLIMRIIEDLPQVVIGTLFLLSYGRDALAIFVILFSVSMFVFTSIRMGKMYPFTGTLSLILSRSSPIDSPMSHEAAPTTVHITLYMAGICFLWTVTCASTYGYLYQPFSLVIMISGVGMAILSLLFCSLWFYYSGQSEVDLDQQFMRGTSDAMDWGAGNLKESLNKMVRGSPLP